MVMFVIMNDIYGNFVCFFNDMFFVFLFEKELDDLLGVIIHLVVNNITI